MSRTDFGLSGEKGPAFPSRLHAWSTRAARCQHLLSSGTSGDSRPAISCWCRRRNRQSPRRGARESSLSLSFPFATVHVNRQPSAAEGLPRNRNAQCSDEHAGGALLLRQGSRPTPEVARSSSEMQCKRLVPPAAVLSRGIRRSARAQLSICCMHAPLATMMRRLSRVLREIISRRVPITLAGRRTSRAKVTTCVISTGTRRSNSSPPPPVAAQGRAQQPVRLVARNVKVDRRV